MKKRRTFQLSNADKQAKLASLKRQLYQLEVDFGMGLFVNKDPREYESIVTQLEDEIRAIEGSLPRAES